MDTIDKNKSSYETNLDAMITTMVPEKTKKKKDGAYIEESDDRCHFIEDLVEVVAPNKDQHNIGEAKKKLYERKSAINHHKYGKVNKKLNNKSSHHQHNSWKKIHTQNILHQIFQGVTNPALK